MIYYTSNYCTCFSKYEKKMNFHKKLACKQNWKVKGKSRNLGHEKFVFLFVDFIGHKLWLERVKNEKQPAGHYNCTSSMAFREEQVAQRDLIQLRGRHLGTSKKHTCQVWELCLTQDLMSFLLQETDWSVWVCWVSAYSSSSTNSILLWIYIMLQ
jgi:hypothetical protein